VELDLVDEAGVERLAGDVGTSADRDVPVARSRLRCLDPLWHASNEAEIDRP
jgi:hypothetical protein